MKASQVMNKPGRSCYVYTVVTWAQRDRIREAARRAGLTVSGWSRRELLKASMPKLFEPYFQLMDALGIPDEGAEVKKGRPEGQRP